MFLINLSFLTLVHDYDLVNQPLKVLLRLSSSFYDILTCYFEKGREYEREEITTNKKDEELGEGAPSLI